MIVARVHSRLRMIQTPRTCPKHLEYCIITYKIAREAVMRQKCSHRSIALNDLRGTGLEQVRLFAQAVVLFNALHVAPHVLPFRNLLL
jgi:hypothetical protein